MCLSACERKRERHVCVCVCERERERVCVCSSDRGVFIAHLLSGGQRINITGRERERKVRERENVIECACVRAFVRACFCECVKEMRGGGQY